ncbi:MAG: SDR family oxidoreductase [Gammaproteobacteria bacterium]|nr:SDR family oxidoreductase [Gammaproteobacteria bacterium]
MDNPLDFSHKTVFVAGGTSGINLGIAQGFAQAGARVSVISRSADKVARAVSLLQDTGAEAIGFSADVRDYQAVEDTLRDTHARFGTIDVLISGAAGNFPAAVLDMSANAFKSVVDIDLLGTFNVVRAGHAFLRKPGASVINISAPQAYVPSPLQAHVCAAKAGVDMLTRVLALEWGAEGLRVNSIVPGPIEGTEGMARLAPTPEILAAVTESVPAGRLGTPEDIAKAAMLLASPLCEYVNGSVFPVDGGWSLMGFGTVMKKMSQVMKNE